MTNSMQKYVHDPHFNVSNEGTFILFFSTNTESFTSELILKKSFLGTTEKMIGWSNLQSHNSVLPVAKRLKLYS